ncbi:recombination protein F [Rubripirellula amarantea]|uniref:Recombination protein F n=1 Tax=Rubripirellula amarantea TaxID=2527999 RepID=A0A5C5WH85_9BACT|nr:AAA family ATPase [Rubripirellula amarantea]TWT49363.1 recombination protein F [Rubripirellula amarantea]
MKIKKFTILNYRAIESVEISLRHSLTPIVGVNESGKTTILQAIQAFDKGRDKYHKDNNHLEFQNRYSTSDTEGSQIIAKISLSEEEFEELEATFPSTATTTDRSLFSACRLGEKSFDLARILCKVDNKIKKRYEVAHDAYSEPAKRTIRKYIVERLPMILYFDDFTDRVPEKVEFSKEFMESGKLSSRGIHREWQELVREIFSRADADGLDGIMNGEDRPTPLRNFLAIDDTDRREAILEDISDMLNKEIIEDWKSLKKSGASALADDTSDLQLRIRPESYEDGSFDLSFRVIDKSSKGKKRPFAVTSRSKGFQWFFNYMTKLKFNPRYKGAIENSIFLLDEPGSYLHSSAQSELLRELKNVSEKNSILYCTHSQYLLNPNVINLGSIKVAKRVEGKIHLQGYGDIGTNEEGAALAPVYSALNLNASRDFVGKVILVEGISDYCVFQMLIKNLPSLKGTVLSIVPASGAGTVDKLLGFAIGFASDFLILLDRDEAGDDQLQTIKEVDENLCAKVVQYGTSGKFLLEDHFHSDDVEKIMKLTGLCNFKKAIPSLFWNHGDCHSDVVNGLHSETLKNLEPTLSRIHCLANF